MVVHAEYYSIVPNYPIIRVLYYIMGYYVIIILYFNTTSFEQNSYINQNIIMYKIISIIKKNNKTLYIYCVRFLLYSGWRTHIILFICEKPFSGFVLCVIYTLYLSVRPSMFLMCPYSPMTHNNKPEVWSYNNKNCHDQYIYTTRIS